MDIEEVKNKITSLEDGGKLWEVISNKIEAEKLTGIEEKQKANREAENLRKRYKPIEETLKTNGFDIEQENWADSLKEIKAKAETGKKATEEKSEYVKQLEELQGKFSSLQEEYKAEKQRSRTNKIKTELSKAMEGRVYSREASIEGLIAMNMAGIDEESGKTYIEVEGQKFDTEKGIEKLIEIKHLDAKVSQNSGSGGSGSGTDSSGTSEEKMRAEMAGWNKSSTLPLVH